MDHYLLSYSWTETDVMVAGGNLDAQVDCNVNLMVIGVNSKDLRLTLRGVADWQAIVEVKGYTSGIKTNDARQIREHHERYIVEESRSPALTLWFSNPYRTMDPSSRPTPDQNVKNVAETIGAVHVLVPDLYRQWALVAAGNLDSESVIQSLVNAGPGLWTPTSPGSGT